MITKIFLTATVLSFILFASSCQNGSGEKETDSDKTGLTEKIATLENKIFNPDGTINTKKALTLLDAYEQFIVENKDDSNRMEYIFKAAGIALNLNRGQTSLKYLEQYLLSYPNGPQAEQALFLKAFVLENSIGNIKAAKQTYEEFIQKYPNSEFADDAKASIKYIGKSPDEIIELMKQEQKK